MGELIYTKEGTGVASFKSAAKVPLTAATINFEPIQAGSGDPSPSNIRPISGLSGLNITLCGKNLWDLGLMESSTNNITYQNGVITGTADDLATQSLDTPKLYNVKSWQHHATLSLSMYTDGNSSTSGNGAQPFFRYSNPVSNKVVYTYPNSTSSYLKKSLSLYNNNSTKIPDWFAFSYYGTKQNVWHVKDFQFELGDGVTEYEPYRGTTIPVDWSSTAGTVYGGYIDLITGELTITHKKLTMTGMGTDVYSPYKFRNKSSDTTRNEFFVGGQTVTALNVDKDPSRINEWVCSHTSVYVRSNFNNNSLGELAALTYFYYNSSSNNYVSEFRLAWPLSSEINTTEKANAWLQEQYNNGTPVEYIYPLMTPETYQLTPLQLSTLIGQNNLFCQEDGITTISVSYPIVDAADMRKSKLYFSATQPHLATVNNAEIAHFSTTDTLPIKDLKISILPVQSGSGTPSPSNVRPISGWNGVTLTHSDKNIWHSDRVIEDRYFKKADGVFIASGDDQTSYLLGGSATERYINFEVPPGTYTMSASSETFSGIYIDFVGGGTWTNGETKTFAAKTLIKAVRCTQVALTPATYYWQLQIEVGQTATTIEPYNAISYPVSWQTEAGTIYGGELDLLTGTLTVTHCCDTYNGTEDGWQFYSGAWQAYIPPKTSFRYGNGALWCDKLKPINNMNDRTANKGNFSWIFYSNGQKIGFSAPECDTLDKFKTWAGQNPITVCYEMLPENYITYQLTPQSLSTLRGINNVWADCGPVNLSYWTH